MSGVLKSFHPRRSRSGIWLRLFSVVILLWCSRSLSSIIIQLLTWLTWELTLPSKLFRPWHNKASPNHDAQATTLHCWYNIWMLISCTLCSVINSTKQTFISFLVCFLNYQGALWQTSRVQLCPVFLSVIVYYMKIPLYHSKLIQKTSKFQGVNRHFSATV